MFPTAVKAVFTVPPKLPRSWTEPSFSQSTACGPTAIGGSTVFEHNPDEPTAWLVVDPEGHSDGVAAGLAEVERKEFPHRALPRPPYDGFKIENLMERMEKIQRAFEALWVLSAILHPP